MNENYHDKERGAVMIVEAAVVFPIMFFIVLFMLMVGSAYFQEARVEKIVIRTALETASRCENPMLDLVAEAGGSVPTTTANNGILPYRYVFTGHTKTVCKEMEGKLKDEINSFGSLGFRGMQVQLDKNPEINAANYFIINFVDCSVKYSVGFPIRMIFSGTEFRLKRSTTIRQPISDPAEFIRNVSTIQDWLERSSYWEKFNETIGNITEKVKPFIDLLN